MDNPKKNNERFIFAIVGDFCSGRETVAKYFVDNFEFTEVKSERKTTTECSNSQVTPKRSIKDIVADNSIKGLVIYPFITEEDLTYVMTRVGFKLLSIETPTKIRCANFLKKFPGKTCDDFFKMDMEELSNNPFWAKTNSLANFWIVNTGTIEDLYTKVSQCYQNITKQYRPCWDDYFMTLAHDIAERCNCRKSKVGAAIVKDNRILGVGYNGTPSKCRNCYEGACERCENGSKQGENLDRCICVHAEENALLEIGRAKAQGATLYTTVYPCLICSKHIAQCGISRVVYDKEFDSELTAQIFKECDVKIKKWIKQIKEVFD